MHVEAGDERAKSLVIGATGLVGGYLLRNLVRRGERPYAMSRSPQSGSEANWIVGDLEKPETLPAPPVTTLYCTADAILLARVAHHFFSMTLKRAVVFSSTSVMTKWDSQDAVEREKLAGLVEAEAKIAAACEANH